MVRGSFEAKTISSLTGSSVLLNSYVVSCFGLHGPRTLTLASPTKSAVSDMRIRGLAIPLLWCLCWSFVRLSFSPIKSPLQNLKMLQFLFPGNSIVPCNCPAAGKAIRPSATTAIFSVFKEKTGLLAVYVYKFWLDVELNRQGGKRTKRLLTWDACQ